MKLNELIEQLQKHHKALGDVNTRFFCVYTERFELELECMEIDQHEGREPELFIYVKDRA